ncbi:hypothetical protein GGI10_003335 [Coemansia sp. RSA 2530]|nr:hypothetical protein GGI10_003335 [Coemansia sp. RSA 2530]
MGRDLLICTPCTKTYMRIELAIPPIRDDRAICPVYAMCKYFNWHDRQQKRVGKEPMFLSTKQGWELSHSMRAGWFKNLLKHCGLKDTAHKFRAVAALEMLQAGMSLVEVKIRAGWATLSHTVDTYLCTASKRSTDKPAQGKQKSLSKKVPTTQFAEG